MQNLLGLKTDIKAFDINMGCSGFIYALYLANNIIKIANQINVHSPSTEIFMQTILPINHEIYIEENGFFPEHNVPLSEQIIQINSMIIHQADVQQYKVIDLHSVFINQDGLMNREYTTDGVHLNNNGYSVWVEYIHGYIQDSQIKN